MDEYQTLNHTKWDCKYHVVFIPKYRRKALFEELRRHLGPVFRTLTEQKESRVEEGHLMTDHVHMLLSIPPKYAVAQVVGYIKGKSAIHIARTFMELLGTRLLRLDRRARRRTHQAIHPPSGKRGQAYRSAAARIAQRGHLQVAHSAARERRNLKPL